MQIIDNSQHNSLAYLLTAADHANAERGRKARELEVHMLNTLDKRRREQAEARAMYGQGERDYHFHNRGLDGQS